MHAQDGWTALMYAARVNHSDCVRLLLDAGADTNVKDKARWVGRPRRRLRAFERIVNSGFLKVILCFTYLVLANLILCWFTCNFRDSFAMNCTEGQNSVGLCKARVL